MTSDPRKFVRLWLTRNNVTIDERGTLQSADNRDNIELFDTMFLDYNEQIASFNYEADKKIKAVPETHLKKALEEFISLHITEERKKLFQMKFAGAEDLSQLRAFCIAVTGKDESHVVAVLAHYLWTIKRRIVNKDTYYQLMPILIPGRKMVENPSRLNASFNPLAPSLSAYPCPQL